MKLGIDIDGVLANFPKAFIERAKELELGFLFPERWEDVEHWYIANNNCDKAFNAVWRTVKYDDSFWQKIEPFSYVSPLDFELATYITSRPISSYDTRKWLLKHGFPDVAVYTVEKPYDKLEACLERELDFFIDDHWETVRYLRENDVNAILYAAPYQRGHDISDLPIIEHLSEVNDVITQLS